MSKPIKIIIEIDNKHQSYKLDPDGHITILNHAPRSSIVGNGNGYYVVRENLTEENAILTIKSWFDQGFVDYSPKENGAAIKVFIPIKRIIEIHILE